jgi:tetratricopeptide (TPR) repeat protein
MSALTSVARASWALLLLFLPAAAQTAQITIDYPQAGAVFPPEFPAPTFLWRDAEPGATVWIIEAAGAKVRSAGERLRLAPMDQRCVSPTNKPPQPPPGHSWQPDAATWSDIRKASPATVVITGYRAADPQHPVSRGEVTIQFSRDPVGAPIFYRDVPLMPSETVKGVIQPLAKPAIPLIAWRLRDVSQISSRLLMTGIYSCANCHSVSADGKTMGMDLDGPRNDKGLYALFPVEQKATIRDTNIVAWSTFQGKLGGRLRVGFMSQVSPHGDYVVTMINDPGRTQTQWERRQNPVDLVSNYFVANFKDYRFLQVFYPTRGILAWYSKTTGKLQPLAGADDPNFVHTGAMWSPDGKFLVFARAKAQDAYQPGRKTAERANDENETQIQYDLYRIPFNDGKGGVAERIAGASQNGMSNSFPKVSPDGKWIVFVQARNGQLMRPDGKLYIVPSTGGEARLMKCNTPLMNSWHSFSPNGRWMVFSSKNRSPYTQMYLTHIDEDGKDTPPILIENTTASNRAVNIPEFVNVPYESFQKLDAPVTEYYRLLDTGEDLLAKRQYDGAIANLRKAVAAQPDEAVAMNSLGVALARSGRGAEALEQYRRVVALSPDFPDGHGNLGAGLLASGRLDEAIPELAKALALNPKYAEAHSNLGTALAQKERLAEAIPHLRTAVQLAPEDLNAQRNLALALFLAGQNAEAGRIARQALTAANRAGDRGMIAALNELVAAIEQAGAPARR